MRNGAPAWTPADDARFIELRRQGAGISEIAAAMGRSPLAIKHRARHHMATGRIEPQKRRAPAWTRREEQILAARRRSGTSLADIAAELGRPKRAILRRCSECAIPGPHRLYTTIEERTIRRMVADGWAVDIIAATIKRSVEATAQKARRMGLSIRGCRRRISEVT